MEIMPKPAITTRIWIFSGSALFAVAAVYYLASHLASESPVSASAKIDVGVERTPSTIERAGFPSFEMIAGSSLDESVVFKSEDGELKLVRAGEVYDNQYLVQNVGDKQVVLQELATRDLIVLPKNQSGSSQIARRFSSTLDESHLNTSIKRSSSILESSKQKK